VVAPDSVKVVVWDRNPLFTPKNFLADVAQLVEQRIENPCVSGSNPLFGTKYPLVVKWYNVRLISDYYKFNSCREDQIYISLVLTAA
jgi:hypothetical protein